MATLYGSIFGRIAKKLEDRGILSVEGKVVIMKRFWLKITGLAIFVLAAVIGVYILWPANSPDERQFPPQDVSTSTVQPRTENPQPKRQLTPEDFQTAATSKPTW